MEELWDTVAYITRYGKQPLSDVLSLTRQDAGSFAAALGRLVARETATKGGGDG